MVVFYLSLAVEVKYKVKQLSSFTGDNADSRVKYCLMIWVYLVLMNDDMSLNLPLIWMRRLKLNKYWIQILHSHFTMYIQKKKKLIENIDETQTENYRLLKTNFYQFKTAV